MKTFGEKSKLPIFTERFRELRGAQTQADFAKFLGISRPTVGFYENGERVPDAPVLARICEKCDVSADWLLGLVDVSSTDMAIREISDRTGLTECAIQTLMRYVEMRNGRFIPDELMREMEQLKEEADTYLESLLSGSDDPESFASEWISKWVDAGVIDGSVSKEDALNRFVNSMYEPEVDTLKSESVARAELVFDALNHIIEHESEHHVLQSIAQYLFSQYRPLSGAKNDKMGIVLMRGDASIQLLLESDIFASAFQNDVIDSLRKLRECATTHYRLTDAEIHSLEEYNFSGEGDG